MDMVAKLELAQSILGYQFQDPSLLWEALQAPGSGVPGFAGRRYTNEGNKPLAGIGDALLSLYVKDRARNYEQPVGTRNPASSSHGLVALTTARIPGVATESLKDAANNHRLAEICDANRITACIVGSPAQGGEVFPRTKGNTIEALLGAVYKDANDDMEPVKTVLFKLGIVTLVTLYTSLLVFVSR